MKLNIGDKVRFLSDVGGGVVTKIGDGTLVTVLQDDGFEMPVLASECVVIESKSDKASASKPIPAKVNQVAPISKRYNYTESADLKAENLNAALLFVPKSHHNPLDGVTELFLVNDCNFFFFYIISKDNGEFLLPLYSGMVEPNTKVLLAKLTSEELSEWGKVKVALMPFKRDKAYKKQELFSATIAFQPAKFAKSGSYLKNSYVYEPAMVIALNKKESELKKMVESLSSHSFSPKSDAKAEPKAFKSPKQTKDLLEIDLHITALLDNTSGLSNFDMLQYQMKRFHEVIKENLTNKGLKIVFIHGKGDGVLKSRILAELKTNYKYDFQDASFREYGFGATMVIIR